MKMMRQEVVVTYLTVASYPTIRIRTVNYKKLEGSVVPVHAIKVFR